MSKRTKFGKCSSCDDKPVPLARCGSIYLCEHCAKRYLDNRVVPLPQANQAVSTGSFGSQRRTSVGD